MCAVVVTFNRRELLARCLRALQGEMGPDDQILVVNNASTDGTREMLDAEFADVRAIHSTENTGGAGGFYAGTKAAFNDGFEFAWLMDDDGFPEPGCLSALLEHAAPNRVAIPIQQEDDGRLYGLILGAFGSAGQSRDVAPEVAEVGGPVAGRFTFTFVGPLVGRGVMESIGLPNPDFFIWFDDFEYALRIQRKRGLQTVGVPSARFRHNLIGQKVVEYTFLGRTSTRRTQAAMRTYYGVRNSLYILRRHGRSRRARSLFLAGQAKALAGDLVYEPERWSVARARIGALLDGWRGNLGKRDI